MRRFGHRRARPKGSVILLIAMFLAIAVFTGSARAEEEEKELGWSFSAELAWVLTTGNSETSTLGLGAGAERTWERALLKLEAGGIRTESTLKTRRAVGTSPDDFVIEETEITEKTAEAYYARGRYDYNVSRYFLVFGGIDWLRNQFAGIDSRFLTVIGAGNTWLDRNDLKFKTDYGVTYTFEEDVVDNPFLKTNFPGARFGYDFFWKVTDTADFQSVFILDWNLDRTEDVRIDFRNELPVSISTYLKLKPAVRLLWRNEPALTEVELFDGGGASTDQKVLVPLEELDVITTVALVFEW